MFDIYKEMWDRRRMIHELSIQEIKKEYAGTLLGFVWGLVNPIVRITVFWFVFSIGARVGVPIEGVSYIAWLAVGMIGWFFINDGFRLSQKSFRRKRAIIKNTPFPIGILPAMEVLFSFYKHLIFLVVMLIVFLLTLETKSIYWFQIIYYDFSAFMLLLGLGCVTAPIVAVSQDFGRFLDTILVFLFWMTPIFWSPSHLGYLEKIIKLNPFHYIVQGYRDSILFHVGFWEYPLYTIYFWGLVLALFIIGNYLFRRMKPIFLDTL